MLSLKLHFDKHLHLAAVRRNANQVERLAYQSVVIPMIKGIWWSVLLFSPNIRFGTFYTPLS